MALLELLTAALKLHLHNYTIQMLTNTFKYGHVSHNTATSYCIFFFFFAYLTPKKWKNEMFIL